MKDKIIWILITIFVLVGLGVILLFTTRPKTIDTIEYMRFSYSSGWDAYSYTRYEIEKIDEDYYLDIKPSGVPEEEIQTIRLDKETINKIIDIFNKYNVSKWNRFNKYDKDVLDGDSFSFDLKTEDNNYISASGYMKWPNNYKEVRKELYDLLNPLYEYKDGKVY